MTKFLIALFCTLAACSAAYAKWPESIWDPLFLAPHHNWHPPLTSFPIVLLQLELGSLILYQVMKRQALDTAAKYFLYLAALSVVPAVITGLHDAGVDLSPSNAILAGLNDRIENFSNFKDPLSVHVLYVSLIAALLAVRLAWRRWFYDPAVTAQRLAFLGSSAILTWLVFAASQIGGSMVFKVGCY